jgi:hypothetical protein
MGGKAIDLERGWKSKAVTEYNGLWKRMTDPTLYQSYSQPCQEPYYIPHHYSLQMTRCPLQVQPSYTLVKRSANCLVIK